MTSEQPTPPLPISALLRPQMRPGEDLPAAQAHQVMLHCALDAACIAVRTGDVQAVARIAELDYQVVAAVIRWLRTLTDGR
ncbi:hypothetical protein [Streptomyces brasiliensis]|uniref:Uncharacterized protein n=1 Tax=Streptomyces brasiliensis TaxID=1954 RepID=A0A917P8E7_9ACTN|nr:hypothetical protein [Streptomyces brasiliensis]GGJ66682.1 hypothetical protein GCM10010121_091640 [Streptomyces brasiliensis]